MRRGAWLLAALVAAAGAQAQTKKDVIEKILAQQRSGIEALADSLAEQSAAPIITQIGPALAARVAPQRRQAVADEMKVDVRKYVDEASALLRERALKLAPATVGRQLDERFSEDELKQLLAILESPINRKYQQLGAEIQKSLVERLVADARSQIDPKLKALDESLVRRLNSAAAMPAAAASAPSSTPAASAARKP